MDFKGLKKYFTPKNKIPQFIGYGIAAFGVLVAIFYWLYFGVPFMIVGVCVVLFMRDSRPSDSDVDATAKAKLSDLDTRARAHIDIHEKPIKAFPPEVFDGYDYSEPDGLLVCRGGDKKCRTNKYSAAEMVFTQDVLHVFLYRFCLTEDSEQSEYMDERYENLGRASIGSRRAQFHFMGRTDGETYEHEIYTLEIRNSADEVILEIPVDAGADVDRAVDAINHLIKSKKAQKQDTV